MPDVSGYQRFFAELKRRRVFRVMAVYGVVGFVLLQVVDLVVPALLLPEWTYRFIALILLLGFPVAIVLAWAFEMTPEGVRRTEAVSAEDLDAIVAQQPASQRWPAGVLGLLGGLAIATAAWWALAPRPASEPAIELSTAAESSAATRELADTYLASLAVLPFANRSADPENEYFTDGVHDDILTELSRLDDLKLISRTSVMRYRDTDISIREIGRELEVATVLEGSVQRSGDRVRITVQLIDAETDDHLWAETYDEELTAANIFAIQSDVARQIVEALEATLVAGEPTEARRPPTESLEAYDKLIEARILLASRGIAAMFQSVDLFREAIALDSMYAAAYTGLAEAHLILYSWDQLTLDEIDPVVKSSLDRALALDPLRGEVHNSRALYLRNLGRLDEAEREWKKAIELAPGHANAHHWFGIMLWELGRYEESRIEMRRALALDPLSRIINTNVGLGLYFARDYQAAIAQYERSLERFPDWDYTWLVLSFALSANDQHEEAIQAARKAVEFESGQPGNWAAGLARALALAGDEDEARRVLEAVADADPMRIAMARVALGDTEEAFRLLEVALDVGSPFLSELGDPAYDQIRDDPRFQAALRQMGLIE